METIVRRKRQLAIGAAGAGLCALGFDSLDIGITCGVTEKNEVFFPQLWGEPFGVSGAKLNRFKKRKEETTEEKKDVKPVDAEAKKTDDKTKTEEKSEKKAEDKKNDKTEDDKEAKTKNKKSDSKSKQKTLATESDSKPKTGIKKNDASGQCPITEAKFLKEDVCMTCLTEGGTKLIKLIKRDANGKPTDITTVDSESASFASAKLNPRFWVNKLDEGDWTVFTLKSVKEEKKKKKKGKDDGNAKTKAVDYKPPSSVPSFTKDCVIFEVGPEKSVSEAGRLVDNTAGAAASKVSTAASDSASYASESVSSAASSAK